MFHSAKRLSRPSSICLLLLPILLAAGCARPFPAERVPKMRWLVLPFEQPPAMATTPKALDGWLLTARVVRQNPRAGDMLADTTARGLARMDFINQFSRIELDYYFADKAELIENEYPNLSRDEVRLLLNQVPRLDYARELGADKLLTGRIVEQRMLQHRIVHWWWSRLDVEVEVIDVASGQREWNKRYRYRKQLASMSGLNEKLIGDLERDLKKEYFGPMIGR